MPLRSTMLSSRINVPLMRLQGRLVGVEPPRQQSRSLAENFLVLVNALSRQGPDCVGLLSAEPRIE